MRNLPVSEIYECHRAHSPFFSSKTLTHTSAGLLLARLQTLNRITVTEQRTDPKVTPYQFSMPAWHQLKATCLSGRDMITSRQFGYPAMSRAG